MLRIFPSFSLRVLPLLCGVLCGLLLGAAYLLGYRAGVSSVDVATNTVERVEYGDSLTFRLTIPPVSSVSYRPSRFLHGLTLRDTVYRDSLVYIPTDTASVVRDYFAQRRYDLDFSSDSTGVFKVSCMVSENRLWDVNSTVVPLLRYIDRTTTVTPQVPLFRPWVFAGVSSDFTLQYGLFGVDIRNRYMLGVGGYHHDTGSGLLFGAGVKFGD